MDYEGHLADMRNQTAVHWAKLPVDGFGNHTYSAGVDVSVRWEDTVVLFTTRSGLEASSQSIVYPAGALGVSDDDMFMLGSVSTLDSNQIAAPNIVVGAYRVMRVDATVDLNNETTMKKVFL